MVRLLNAIGVQRGPKARAGGEHEPSRKGDSGDLEKICEFNISVEAILMHFETIFSC